MPRANLDDLADLSFLQPRDTRTPPRQIVRAAIGSVLVHLAVAIIVVSLPDAAPSRQPLFITPDVRKAIPLVAPRYFDLTQKDPNRGKVTRTLDIRSALAPAPAPVPATPYRPPALIPRPPAQSPPTAPV